jgi:hypothetical protein
MPVFRAGAHAAYLGVMTMTIRLHGQLADALEAEAARRGQSPGQVAADLLAEQLPPSGRRRRRLAFAGIGESFLRPFSG